MKKRLLISVLSLSIVLMMAVQSLPLSIFAVDASGEEPQSQNSATVNVTIDLNGGTQKQSTAAVNATIPADGYVLTHENVRTLLGGVQPTKASGDISAITTNASDVNNVLWGLFVDTNGNGEVDGEEKLYRSGDTLKVADGTTLKCWYNPYVIVRSGSNLAYAYTSASAWSAENPGGYKETYTAQDLQALYWPITGLIAGFLGNGNTSNTTTKYVEIPNTVKKLNGGQFNNPFYIANVTGLEQVTELDHYALQKMGTYANNAERYLVFENIEEFDIAALAMSYSNSQTARFIFAGRGAGVADTDVHKILSCTDKDRGYTLQNLFYSHNDNCKGVEGDFTNPSAYVYVPYGQTSLWYPSEDNYASTSFKTQYSGTALTNANMPMREMYVVSFDLNGGTINGAAAIKDTYMDAGAVSVTRGNTEVNMFNAATDGYSVNPAAQDVSLLKAKKPQNPTLAGNSFAGWVDQYGNKWDDAVWEAGGYAGVDYGTEGVKLTATYAEIVTLTVKAGDGYFYTNGAWNQDDIVLAEPKGGELILTRDNVKAIFGTTSPRINTSAENYNNLFFGLVDEDGNEYRLGDKISLTGDLTLTAKFGNDMQYQANGTGYVALVKVYPETDASGTTLTNANATAYYKEHYTAWDFQPMYYDVNRINGDSFGQGYNRVKSIELPETVTVLQNNGPMMNLYYLESINLNNVETIGFYGLQQAGNNATGDVRLVFENIKHLAVTALYYGNNKDLDRRFIFAGHGANVTDAQLATILGGDNRGSYGGAATDIFFHSTNVWNAAAADLAADYQDGNVPSSMVYVPYGQTDKWYPSEALYTTGKTSFTTLYKADGTTPIHGNMPMREMYVVSFELDGGKVNGSFTVADTYMDARAVSVIRGGAEANLFETVDGAHVMNPAAQQLALLKAEKPADPEKDGYRFAGWKDQNGHIWTDEEWAAGGYAYDYGADGAQLTAVWEEDVCSHTYGADAVCTECGEKLAIKGATLSLGSNISVLFFVDNDALNGYEAANSKITATFEGKEYVLEGKLETVNGVEGYVYRFTEIDPAYADKKISAVLSVSKDGEAFVNAAAFEYSVLDYCKNTIADADNSLKTVIVDLVNFAATAQAYNGLEVTATNNFDAYQSYASGEVESYKDDLEITNGAVTWAAATLNIKQSIAAKFLFTADSVEGLTATVKVGDKEQKTVSEFETVVISGTTYYIVTTDYIDVADLDEVITVTIGDAEITYSVETYAYAKQDDAEVGAIAEAMVKYIRSANAYFGGAQ